MDFIILSFNLGPTAAVVEDFVRMLWEIQVEKVVMLTNLTEKGKVRSLYCFCDQDKWDPYILWHYDQAL